MANHNTAGAILIAGVSGSLGSDMATRFIDAGRPVIGLSRRASSLALPAEADYEAHDVDFVDTPALERVLASLVERRIGLGGLVLAHGAVAFGHAKDTGVDVVARLFQVNTLASMHIISRMIPLLAPGSYLINLSAVVAETPLPNLAAYSASKSAVSSYLQALRHEVRKQQVHLLDVRLPHIENDFAKKAFSGQPPTLPQGHVPHEAVDRIFESIKLLETGEAGRPRLQLVEFKRSA